MTDADRKQIGLSEDGTATIAMLTVRLGWFSEAQEAGRFALAYAVREGVVEGEVAVPVETRWSADGFDPTGEIRTLLRATYPENKTPIRLIEYLIDEGLRRIAAKVAEGKDSPLDFLT
jgi:hypothetical protein